MYHIALPRLTQLFAAHVVRCATSHQPTYMRSQTLYIAGCKLAHLTPSITSRLPIANLY